MAMTIIELLVQTSLPVVAYMLTEVYLYTTETIMVLSEPAIELIITM